VTINHGEARSLEFYLTHGTPAQGAHDISVQLQAIEPYTDRQLSKLRHVLTLLDQLERDQQDTAASWRTTIHELATEATK